MSASLPEFDWNLLEEKAIRSVRSCQKALPKEIGRIADKVPVIYRKWHPEATCLNDEAADSLGEYLSFEENRLGEANGPVALYLGAIRHFCESDGLAFEEEVRLTYLHELGHHFGWDEEELSARGLD